MRSNQQIQQRLRQQWIQRVQQQRQQQARDHWDQMRHGAAYSHYRQSRQPQSGCFIATAACGSAQAVEVVRLQQFRDAVLRQTVLGRAFIKAYEYLSPPIARCIAHSRFARRIVRCTVVRPAGWVATRLYYIQDKAAGRLGE